MPQSTLEKRRYYGACKDLNDVTFNQVVRGSNPRTLMSRKEMISGLIIQFDLEESEWIQDYADVAELADALDLGSSVPDVQVQVLSSANTYIS